MKHFTALLFLAPTSLAAAQFHAPDFEVPWVGYETNAYPNGLSPQDAVLEDLNGDGHLDLAVVSWPTNAQLSILFGDGTGAFATPVVHDLPDGSKGLAAEDLDDDDGDVDLVVTEFGWGPDRHDLRGCTRTPGDGAFRSP